MTHQPISVPRSIKPKPFIGHFYALFADFLGTASKQHGLKIPIAQIREIAGTDKQGTSAVL